MMHMHTYKNQISKMISKTDAFSEENQENNVIKNQVRLALDYKVISMK